MAARLEDREGPFAASQFPFVYLISLSNPWLCFLFVFWREWRQINFCYLSIHARCPSSHNMPKKAPQILASTYASIDAQISFSVNLPTQCSYFTVTHTRASPSFRASRDVHHGTRLSQDFMDIQHQRQSSPNVPASQHLQHTNIPTQNFSLNFPFAHGASSQMSFFQTDTNFCSQPVHPDCLIRTSSAVHQGATLQPQTQVTRSAASYSLLPLSDSIHNVPSSSLRVTISDAHHICYTPPDAHCQVSSSQYFLDIQPQQISSPTQVGANRSSSPWVRSHDASSKSRHPTMQPSEAKRRKSAGKSNS